jgi:hypothetical protein
MKSLQEIGQFVHTTRTVIGNDPDSSLNQPSKYKGKTLDEILKSWNFSDVLPLCTQLRDWQGNVYRNLENHDIYIAAAPSAGKTLPYLCHWLHKMLGLTIGGQSKTFDFYLKALNILLYEPETLKKLVVMMPIRQLTQQTTEEFKLYFSRILASFVGKLVNIAIDTAPFATHVSLPAYVSVYKRERDKILKIVDPRLVGLLNLKEAIYSDYEKLDKNQTGYLESSRRIKTESEKIETQFRNVAREGLRNIVQGLRGDYSFVAERTGLGTSGDIRRSPVILTIYESTPKIINDIGKNSIAMLVCDEAHLIQRQKFNDDIRPYTITNALYDVLNSLKDSKYRLLFLSGTENPNSAKNIANYINEAFKRNMSVVVPPSSASNPSDVQIMPDDSLYNEKTLLDIIKKSSSNANVIIIFSKRKIDDLAKKAIKGMSGSSLQQIEKGGYSSYSGSLANQPKRYGDIAKNPNKFSQKDTEEMGAYAAKGRDALDIYDQTLRLCVQSGFGYIYRLDDREKYFDQRKHDNAIVGRLFREGKIKTLLATDAIGIGLNITVKNMFIPSIMKPSGSGQKKEMNAAQLAQLLHRTGRGAFRAARIFTPAKYVATVGSAFSMSPSEFSAGITINKFTTDMLRSKNFFTDLWRA